MNDKERDLIALQKEWYKKLADDGFEDIEYFDHSMEPRDMMVKEASKLALTHAQKFTATEQYYIEAGQFYWSHAFSSPLNKQVWFLHSEGIPHRKIVAKLGVSYQSIRSIINKYKTLMFKERKTENQDSI